MSSAATTKNLNMTGNFDAEVIIVADAPAPGTYEQGKCMASHVAKVFMSAASSCGFSVDDFAFVIPCPPVPDTVGSSAKREDEFTAQYRDEFFEALKTFSNARCIVPLGSLATKLTLQQKVKITQVKGKISEHKNPATGLPVFPMLNPLMILRRAEMKEIFETDFRHFRSFYDSNWDLDVSSRLTQQGDYGWRLDISDWVANPPTVLSVDTETRDGWWYRGGRIITVQLSREKGESVVIPLDIDYVRYWNQPEHAEKSRACGFPEGLSSRQRARVIGQLKQLLSNPDVHVVGHNFKFDLHHFLNLQIEVANWWADTIQLAWTVDENMQNKSLDDCIRRWVPEMAGYADKFNDTWDKEHMELVPPWEMVLYAGGDTDAVLRLAKILDTLAREDERHHYVFETVKMPALRTFFRMERYGIIIDTEALTAFRKVLDARIAELYEKMIKQVPAAVLRKHDPDHGGGGLSFTRPQFIVDALFSREGLGLKPIIFTETTASLPNPADRIPATAYEHLVRFADKGKDGKPKVQLAADLIEFAELQKMAGTYVGSPAQPDTVKLLKNGKEKVVKGDPPSGFWQYLGPENRIHSSFFLHRTVTGRTASADPNGQNIPKRGDLAKPFRKVFKPTPGYTLVEADLSQIELRLTAIAANERVMQGVYRRGGDIHKSTAALTLGMTEAQFNALPKAELDKARRNAKAGNFGLIYGMSAPGFQNYAFNEYGVKFSDRGAADFRNNYFVAYPGLLPWHKRMKAFVGRHGYVRSLHGQLRRLPSIESVDGGVKAESERQAINAPIQGFASDLGLIAMYRFGRDCDWEIMRPLTFVHDAIVIEARNDVVREAATALRWYMENAPLEEWFGLTLPIPIEAGVGVGPNLADIEEVDWGPVKPSWFTSDALE